MTDQRRPGGPPAGPDHDHDPPRRPPEAWEKAWRRRLAEGTTWTPWLLIRHDQTDLGFRPAAPGATTWASPDIWIESRLGYSDKAIAGEANHVHVQIFNIGRATALPAQVDFYWGDPSLGLGPGNLVHIGTEWVTIVRKTAKIVRCSTPWFPDFVNGGHECIVVNCSGIALDRIKVPFASMHDRHVGQRNITVLPGAPGQTISFKVLVNNPFPVGMRATVALRTEHVALAPGTLERLSARDAMNHVLQVGALEEDVDRLLTRFKKGTREQLYMERKAPWLRQLNFRRELLAHSVDGGRGAARVSAGWEEHQAFIDHPEGRSHLVRFLEAADCLNPSRRPEHPAIAQIGLLPNEQRRLSLDMEVPQGARQGEYVVFHLAQQLEDLDVGGYSVVVQIAER